MKDEIYSEKSSLKEYIWTFDTRHKYKYFIHKLWQEIKSIKLKLLEITYIANDNHEAIKGRKFSVTADDVHASQISSTLPCILIRNTTMKKE